MRSSPTVKKSIRDYDCTFLASGYDTLEESASVYILEETWKRLEEAKAAAAENNTGSNQAYTTVFCGMEFQIKPHGGAGVSFLLSNQLFTVAIRPAKVPFNISVTYRARTLWQYGPDEARRMIWGALLSELKQRPVENEHGEMVHDNWRRVSRADFCFDIRSPELTQEMGADMVDRIVCHSSSKARWDFKAEDLEGYAMGTSNRIQTLTIGKKGSLQVQIYDKSAEITEKSQKTWMYKIWSDTGEVSDVSNVWRVELRFGREYLAARNIDTFEDFEFHRERLLSEALKTRRLTDKTMDSNKRRWPLHPVWNMALEKAGNALEMVDLGRHREPAADAIIEKIIQDMAAALRRNNVLEVGDGHYDGDTAWNFLIKILDQVENDEEHGKKMREYAEKYKYINEPL